MKLDDFLSRAEVIISQDTSESYKLGALVGLFRIFTQEREEYLKFKKKEDTNE